MNRKPLVLKEARQVGKTWLMKDFGQRFYAGESYEQAISFVSGFENSSVY